MDIRVIGGGPAGLYTLGADEVLRGAAVQPGTNAPSYETTPILDGKLITETAESAYKARHQPGVPLLLGGNSADTAGNRLRLASCVNGHAAVTLLFSAVEITMPTGWIQHGSRQVRFLRLDFLQAHDVSILDGKPVEEAFGRGGADAVEVESDDA